MFLYTVIKGDSLFSLADRFDTTVSNIIKFTKDSGYRAIKNENLVFEGETLVIEGEDPYKGYPPPYNSNLKIPESFCLSDKKLKDDRIKEIAKYLDCTYSNAAFVYKLAHQ